MMRYSEILICCRHSRVCPGHCFRGHCNHSRRRGLPRSALLKARLSPRAIHSRLWELPLPLSACFSWHRPRRPTPPHATVTAAHRPRCPYCLAPAPAQPPPLRHHRCSADPRALACPRTSYMPGTSKEEEKKHEKSRINEGAGRRRK
ncbi:Protein of unknown function [Gryllus bimaculatus]|nr:Protein of unknown function [Gryllus bimaculatus]